MANTYLTIEMITFEMLEVLHNNIVAAKHVTRTYESQFAKAGAKIGALVQIRKPPLYSVSKSITFDAQDYQELMVPLTVDQHRQIGVEFVNDDLTLSMDDFSGRVLKPAMVPMGNEVDTFILSSIMPTIWNGTGTPGTIAATDTPFLDALTLLVSNAAPDDELYQLVNPTVSARLSSGLAGRFNPQTDASKFMQSGSMDKGMMGEALGWYFFRTQNMPVHVTGAWGASNPGTGIQVDGANQVGSSILLKGATVNIVGMAKRGDIVQLDGVFMVNPITRLNTGLLQNFVITADADSTGGGALTINISPSIILAGKNQTVTNSPADSATVFVWGTSTVANVASKTSPQCMGWEKKAITLACVDLEMPGANEGVNAVRASDPDSGLSVLYMRSFDPRAYSRVSRMDMLFGAVATRPEHCSRTAS